METEGRATKLKTDTAIIAPNNTRSLATGVKKPPRMKATSTSPPMPIAR